MSAHRCIIIVNPYSGMRKGLERARALASALRRRDFSADVSCTEYAGHAVELARRHASVGSDLIIGAGGDGTLNEVAHGILTSANPATPLSFLNSGTGGDFARLFSLPKDAGELADRIVGSSIRAIDIGRIECFDENGQPQLSHFINIASAGFTGNVVRAVNASRLRGRMPASTIFPFYILDGIARYRPYRFHLTFDGGREVEVTCAAIVVANGRYFGSGLEIAPKAEINDGLFDVVVVPARSRLGIVSALGMVRRGAHLEEPDVVFRRARSLRIEAIGGSPEGMPWLEADGETPGRLPATFSILQGALNVCA